MKKGMMKVASVVMSVTVAMSTLGLGGTTATAAGLPTTDGHDKYVDKAVFDVIGSDTFGTKPLDNPLFDKTKGSSNITNLQVPVLAYDDTSIGVVWNKPEKYDNVADYKVWVNGELKETARENFKKNAAWTATYMEAFYDYYNTQGKSDVEMVNVDIHSFRATGLTPDTEYTIKVIAIDKDGNELGEAREIKQRTTKTPEAIDITTYGATKSEGYTTYNDEVNALVEKNTKAIQAAIDACPVGGKVVVPEGIFVTGALWLKSDMTLEVNGTLWASPNSDHFEIGFLMYPFYTDTRGWGLVNAMSADESAPIKNVRVTGTGTLYGNGWKYGAGNTVYQDGVTSNKGVNTQAGDPTDTQTWGLPRYCGGSNTKVFYQGIQAKDSSYKYLKNTGKYTEAQLQAVLDATTEAEATAAGKAFDGDDLKFAYATRSSLLIMRNCENVYVGDITIENPSNHSVNILDSRNIATTNVKVFSFDGNNGDGLGFGCSKDVICWGNFTDTGDDNLGFGASVGEGARDCDIQTNSEVWMFNNFLREGHGGLAAGSHTGNGIQDVLFEDTVMNHIDMAFRFKSAPTNGGFGANITMRDCAVADTNQGWVLTTSYGDPNSASSTEWAEIGEFYNFASYNISMYTLVQNTIQVLADIDPVGSVSKPLHTHHNLYFQDITFGDVGKNGSYKNKNGWETLIGCENAVFYNVYTKSYNSKAIEKKTNTAWNNIQYCKNLIFQGTTMDSPGACVDKMNAAMSPITVANNTVTAENVTVGDGDDNNKPVVTDTKIFDAEEIAAATGTNGLTAVGENETENADGTFTYEKAPWTTAKSGGFAKDYPDITQVAKSPNRVAQVAALKVGDVNDDGEINAPDAVLLRKVCAKMTVTYNAEAADINGDKEINILDAVLLLKHLAGQDVGLGEGASGFVNADGKIPTAGSYLKYDADKNGVLSIFHHAKGEGKDYYVVDSDGTVVTKYTSTSTGDEYVISKAEVKAGKSYYIYSNKIAEIYRVAFEASGSTEQPGDLKRESVDISKGIIAGEEHGTPSGVYGTVTTLEDTPVLVLAELSTPEEPKTIDGITYTQFIQANTAANAGGLVPDNGTATFVFSPKVDCSVTLHSRATSKIWWFVESPDGANATATQKDSVNNNFIEESMTFNLKAGRKYYYYAHGSKPMIYGIYFDKPVDDAQSLITPSGSTGGSTGGSTTTTGVERKVKLTWTPVTNDTEVFYGVDTYVGDTKVDMVDGIKDPTTTIGRLSSGVEYTFKVYVSEKGDNANSMTTTGVNKTLVGETKITVDGGKDTTPITVDTENTKIISLVSPVYTCAHGTWTNVAKQDARVRGYKIYANDKYIKTLYNYQVSKYTTVDSVVNQIGRLTPGVDNKVEVVAFTDAGLEYKYPAGTVKTLENYDYKAPVWATDAKVTAAVQENGDVVVTWPAATDDTKVGGYRLYVDGKPVYADANSKAFNPVNGAKTTTETTYTLKGLDLTKEHTVTVQAGDTWWKAEDTLGAYDKMAGFNWTVKGLTATIDKGGNTPEVPVDPNPPVNPGPDTPENPDDSSKFVTVGDENITITNNGNEMNIKQTATEGRMNVTAKKFSGKGVSWVLFPESEAVNKMTLKVKVNSFEENNANAGVFVGAFQTSGEYLFNSMSIRNQANDNAVSPYWVKVNSKDTSKDGNSGNGSPKATYTTGDTYNVTVEKKDGVYTISWQLGSAAAVSKTFTSSDSYLLNQAAQFGIAITSADVTISDWIAYDANGNTVYEQGK